MSKINQILNILPGKIPALEIPGKAGTSEAQGRSFSQILAESIGQVNDLAARSSEMSLDLALGRPVELHQVMIAGTKAGIALELLIEVRNKLIEAWQEISRMSV